MPREPRLRWTDVRLLYVKELRSALRERNIVVHSVLIPVFLYPVVLWLAYSFLAFAGGQTAGLPSRVRLEGAAATHPALMRRLAVDRRLRLVTEPVDDAERAIRDGRLEVLVRLEPAPAGPGLEHNVRVRLYHDESKDRSAAGRQRIREALERHRRDVIDEAAWRAGVDTAALHGFTIESHNVSSGHDMGRFILGLLLPFFLVLMLGIGGFYPAIDATAGEREHHTWETSLTMATPRAGIVLAKYLYVATLSSAAGLLNLAAMTVSMKSILRPLLGPRGGDFTFAMPWSALPVIVVGTILLALAISAVMMILASFARTFKEGQTMVSPFYVALVLPLTFLMAPGLELTPALALVPVVNVALLFREAIGGTFDVPMIALTAAVQLATVAGLIALATRILAHEDLVLGSYGGSLMRFLKERGLSRRPPSVRHG